MNQETKTLTIRKYKDPAGNPTCASNFTYDEICHFLWHRNLGSIPYCSFTGKDLLRYVPDYNFIKPTEECPLWDKGDVAL